MEETYDIVELAQMPTLCVSQSADLKVENGAYRIWLSRCVDEGESPIMVERYDGQCWVDWMDSAYSVTITTEGD